VDLSILISILFAATAYSFHLTSSFGLWRKVLRKDKTQRATDYALNNMCRNYYESRDVLSFYEDCFADCVEVCGGECIVPSVLKPRDLHGNTQLINPLAFNAVDVSDLLPGVVATINGILKESPLSIARVLLGQFAA